MGVAGQTARKASSHRVCVTAFDKTIFIMFQNLAWFAHGCRKRRNSWACRGNPKLEQETIKGAHAQETPAYQRRPTTLHEVQGSNPPIRALYMQLAKMPHTHVVAPCIACSLRSRVDPAPEILFFAPLSIVTKQEPQKTKRTEGECGPVECYFADL